MIVLGDRQVVEEIIKSVYATTEISKQYKTYDEEGLLLDEINEKAALIESKTVLEFLILSFCQSFKLTPRLAAGLLVEGGAFLSQIIVKGLQGEYESIYL